MASASKTHIFCTFIYKYKITDLVQWKRRSYASIDRSCIKSVVDLYALKTASTSGMTFLSLVRGLEKLFILNVLYVDCPLCSLNGILLKTQTNNCFDSRH